MDITKEELLIAHENIANLLKITPCDYNEYLSEKFSANIYLKREDLQVTNSFKVRGVLNFFLMNKDQCIKYGVVCASAGNHSQGVAYICKKYKIYGDIFLPKNTPKYKINKTQTLGGKYITLHIIGDTFDESYKASKLYASTYEKILIPPFNNKDIITGQSSIGNEILHQVPSDQNIDMIIAPIGGGGLISGLISYVNLFSPDTTIYGAELEGAESMKISLENSYITELENINSSIDGASVSKVGKYNYNICKEYNLQIETANYLNTVKTTYDLFSKTGIQIELVSALGITVLENIKSNIKGKNIVLIISGGNITLEKLLKLYNKVIETN